VKVFFFLQTHVSYELLWTWLLRTSGLNISQSICIFFYWDIFLYLLPLFCYDWWQQNAQNI